MDYHHASCWSPTEYWWGKSTTKKFFTSLPGLLSDPVQKYLPKNNQPYLVPLTIKERPTINIGNGTARRTRSRTRKIYPIQAVRRHQYCLPQDSGFNRKILHRPNRKVISDIHQGQQVYNGSIPLWSQNHPCKTSKNTIRTGFKDWLQETPQPIDQQRLKTWPKNPVKWMSQCAQKFHERSKWEISVSPVPHPSQKLSRTVHSDFQRSFHY